MFQEILDNVRQKAPLVHNITNYVTVNDCANITLACGASPIMADALEEAEDIAAICAAVNLNTGTLNGRTIPSMLAAGRAARRLGRPVVLDPVGAGASPLRTDTAAQLLTQVRPTVVRGNISEIKALASGGGATRGVDANVADRVTPENLEAAVAFVKDFARRFGCVAAVTGAIDIVSDAQRAFCIFNGHPMMAAVTGSGCQLSSLTAAFLGANPDLPLKAAAAAVCAMGICGETAFSRLSPLDGNCSYRSYIIDAVYRLTGKELEEKARYELR